MPRMSTAADHNTPLKNGARVCQKAEILQADIASLQTMSHTELADFWRQMLGTAVPHNLSKRLLMHALAHELQVRAHSGLKTTTKQMLADAVAAARQIDTILTYHTTFQSDGSSAGIGAGVTSPLSASLQEDIIASCLPQSSTRTPPQPLTLSPGTRLMREWRGVVHVVDRTDGRFMWNGKVYGSLSAIARAITGVRWNGLAFFGLRKRKEDRTNKANNISTDAFTANALHGPDQIQFNQTQSHPSHTEPHMPTTVISASPCPSPATDPAR